jgi:hypothetical protein
MPGSNLLTMSIKLYNEARWYFGNLALLLVVVFGLVLVQGFILIVTANADSVAPGAHTDPVLQVLSWAFAGMGFFVVWAAPPALAVALAGYRIAVKAVGHPRAVAYVAAAISVAALAPLIPRDNPLWLGLVTITALVYASVLRLPGQRLDTLPTAARGSIQGLALSFVFLVGSFVAACLAFGLYRRGKRAEAGWFLVAGAAIPGLLFCVDLLRPDVPTLNFLITAFLAGAVLVGLFLIGRSSSRSASIPA